MTTILSARKLKKMRVGPPSRFSSRCSATVLKRTDEPQESFYYDVKDGEFAALSSGYLSPLEEISPTDRPPDKVRSGGEW